MLNIKKIEPHINVKTLKSQIKIVDKNELKEDFSHKQFVRIIVSFIKYSQSSDTECDSFQKLNSLSIFTFLEPILSQCRRLVSALEKYSISYDVFTLFVIY